MSYSLMFSVSPVPQDDCVAWDEFDEREQENEELGLEPHPDIMALVAKLTEQFPCISTLPAAESNKSIWSGGPLSQNIQGDLAVFGVSRLKVTDVLPEIRTAAMQLGITLYDPQQETIYRPPLNAGE